MAVDVTRLNFVDGMYGLSLVAIACCACALVYMAALFTVAVPSSKVMRYGIEARVVPGADLDGFVGYRSGTDLHTFLSIFLFLSCLQPSQNPPTQLVRSFDSWNDG